MCDATYSEKCGCFYLILAAFLESALKKIKQPRHNNGDGRVQRVTFSQSVQTCCIDQTNRTLVTVFASDEKYFICVTVVFVIITFHRNIVHHY